MIEEPIRLLFVPVSGPSGMGEYSRSLLIANAAAVRWPRAAIHFVLSREAPYATDTPFPTTLLPSSPTFHPRAVAALIKAFRPHLVLFDNAGRTRQLSAARRVGARVVFISSRSTPRRRAFRPRWMRLLDEHWIAYPPFLAGPLRWSERLKLRLLGRPRVRFLNPLVPDTRAQLMQEVLTRFGIAREYILIVPGGGTARVNTQETLRAIAEAARLLADSGHTVVLVGLQPPEPSTHVPEGLRLLPRLPGPTLAALLRGTTLAIVSGGYTLLQALACDCACIALPLAGDQPARIDACVRAGVALRCEASSQAIKKTTIALLNDSTRLECMRTARSRLGLSSGAEVVVDALAEMLS